MMAGFLVMAVATVLGCGFYRHAVLSLLGRIYFTSVISDVVRFLRHEEMGIAFMFCCNQTPYVRTLQDVILTCKRTGLSTI